MDSKSYFMISGLIFALVAVGHIIRVMYNLSFVIGTWNAPMWLSWAALFAASAMCVWAVSLATR